MGIIPAALAKADVSASAVDQNGDKAICVTAHLQKESADDQGDCSGAACESICECTYSSCSDQASACLADAACAAKQSCVLACACGDTGRAASCAADDTKALAVVSCISSSCSGGFTV